MLQQRTLAGRAGRVWRGALKPEKLRDMLNLDELERMLGQTLDDRQLSRGERRALREVLQPDTLSSSLRVAVRERAFRVADSAIVNAPDARAVVAWLRDVTALLEAAAPSATTAEVLFTPGESCRHRLMDLIADARRTVDVCMFTITDDRLAERLYEAHRRGVRVRIVTDNLKAEDLGSDIDRLQAGGVRVAKDRDPAHMHHKFALFDRALLVNGSYNWTRSAFVENRENVMITDDVRLVQPYTAEFDRLWASFGDD